MDRIFSLLLLVNMSLKLGNLLNPNITGYSNHKINSDVFTFQLCYFIYPIK